MDLLGFVRIRIHRGINLAVRDVTMSSDPYVTITCGSQKVKTTVVKDNCNPVWDEELTVCIKDLNAPIVLSLYDKDTFTEDDKMGNAVIDIKPLIECRKMGLQDLPDGSIVENIEPTKENHLTEESCIIWNKGKMTQDMVLKLNNVECGELVVQIECVELYDREGLID